MNTKVVGKSLLGIVSLIVLVISLIFILCGIYVESTQQNGTGYELAFVSLVVFALSLWINMSVRKGLNAARMADEQNKPRVKGDSDAPVLRTTGAAEADHEMPRLHLSSEDDYHEHFGQGANEQSAKVSDEMENPDTADIPDHEGEFRAPPKWWYADNREEPTLNFTHRHDADETGEAGGVVTPHGEYALHNDAVNEPEGEYEYQQEPVESTTANDEDMDPAPKSKHGWFGFDEYEEPEWIEEESAYSEDDEKAEDEHEEFESVSDQPTFTAALHDTAPEDPHGDDNRGQVPTAVQSLQPAPQQKPRIRVTAKVQDTIRKN